MTTNQLKQYFPVIPIIKLGGAVQAGFPSPAMDYVEDAISLDKQFIKNPLSTFLIQVTGDSMTGAHIPPGAWLVVDRSVTPKNMNIVVAVIDGEPTVKHFKKEFNKCFLIAANPKYKPIEITEFMRFEVWGTVTAVIHVPNPIAYVRFS